MNGSAHIHLIVLGTEPRTGRGGIATALEGFHRALDEIGVGYTFIPTHSAQTSAGRWVPWLKSFARIRHAVAKAQAQGLSPVAYVHMGGGVVSTIRKSVIALFLRMIGVPSIMQLHGPEVATYLAQPLSSIAFRFCLLSASEIAVLTPWWADLLRNSGVRQKLHVVPNVLPGYAETAAQSQRPISAPKKQCTILTMSRMTPGKGFDTVLDATTHLQQPIRLLFAGTGPMENQLRQSASDLQGGTQVEFLGWVSGDDKAKFFCDADIFCLPSQYDSFGVGYVEAMAFGLPVIALKIGPIVDVVPANKCGILIKQNDVHGLAAAIDRLSTDQALRKTMGENAKKWVLSQYSSEAVGQNLQKIFQGVA
ncbi:MAG TPA: hypothetical protein DD437_12335 [Rhodobiaceae bacterium]|nr:hypothetical protein [Rhodobiaceae bacterium]|tara:strand:- start:2088 stop:3182 length:1095 start_codon:yes stop_codon:yes gene_type:complete